MKRIGYIYEKIIDVENCKQAIMNASKKKKNRKCVIQVLDNLDFYAQDLSNRLQELRFTTPYRMKAIKDQSSKKERIIAIPKFYPDLCAQHAINLIITPYVERSSYYYSCANFKGRGMKRAHKGTKRAMRCKYCLKTDIRKFYPSIDNEKLKIFLTTKIKDEKALGILNHLIDSIEGLPIGNYTSPNLAEWYLQDVDRLIKEKLKIKVHIRYADDKVLGDNNKKKLHNAYNKMNKMISSKGLVIKDNYQLFRIHDKTKSEKAGKGRKIDFIGNCYSQTYVTIRKRTSLTIMKQSLQIKRFFKRNLDICLHICSGFMSRRSAFLHTNSFAMKKKYGNHHIKELKDVIRRNSKCLNGKNNNLTNIQNLCLT